MLRRMGEVTKHDRMSNERIELQRKWRNLKQSPGTKPGVVGDERRNIGRRTMVVEVKGGRREEGKREDGWTW